MKKAVRILTLVLVVILLISTMSTVLAANIFDTEKQDPIGQKLARAGFYNGSSTNIEPLMSNEITIVVSNYLAERLEQYGKLTFDESKMCLYVDPNNSETMEDTFMLMEAQIEILSASGEKLGYRNFEYSIDYKNVNWISDTKVEVCLYLNYDIIYNGFDGIVSSISNEPHKLILEKVNGNWLIADHEEFDPIHISVEEKIRSKASLDAFLADYVSGMIERNKAIDASFPANINENIEPRSLTSYDRSAACRYARTYANSNNPSPWHTFDLDCTNFVSIALRQGGIPQDTSGSNIWYWNSRSDRSASWAGANYLRPYLIGNNSSSSSNSGVYATNSSLSNCSRGDVVSFESGGDIYHNAILTSYSESGGWLLCQHSHSQGSKDVPLQTVINHEGATVYYTHIRGYN